jgi:hypothetical protein
MKKVNHEQKYQKQAEVPLFRGITMKNASLPLMIHESLSLLATFVLNRS